MLRYTVHFSGHVQGVGFRYTAVRLAEDYAVAGYVQNLPDGRVRLVAEGKADQLDGLVEAIRQRMSGHVRDVRIDTSPGTEEFGRPTTGALGVRY